MSSDARQRALKAIAIGSPRDAHKLVSECLLEAGIVAANQTLTDHARYAISDEES